MVTLFLPRTGHPKTQKHFVLISVSSKRFSLFSNEKIRCPPPSHPGFLEKKTIKTTIFLVFGCSFRAREICSRLRLFLHDPSQNKASHRINGAAPLPFKGIFLNLDRYRRRPWLLSSVCLKFDRNRLRPNVSRRRHQDRPTR